MLARIDQVTGKGYNYTIVLAGTNDLAQGVSNLSYYSNLLDIVSRLQTDRQNVILSTIPPFGWHLSNTSERNNVIRRVAYERNACYVDIFTDVFEGTYNQSLFFDGVHPNDNAHYLMALEYNDSITNCIRYDCQANPQNCYAPPVNQPTGWFDGIKNTIIPSVGGWACDPDNYSRYLTIHLYLDGPYPSGTFIGITVANLSGESAIGAYCGGTTSHRFVYNIPPLDYGIGRDYRVYAYALDYPISVNKTLLGGSPAILKSKPLLGAIRWDFYFNNSYDLHSLSRDQKWHYRIPLTSQIAWNGTAYNAVGGVDTQDKIDYEIAAAKRGGIDYWAFLYYDPNVTGKYLVDIGGNESSIGETRSAFTGLSLYLNSTRRNDVKFAIFMPSFLDFYVNGTPNWEKFDSKITGFARYFKMDNYQKAYGDRPLVFFFGDLNWLFAYFFPAKRTLYGDFYKYIANKSREAGLEDPYFIVLEFTPSVAVNYTKTYGLDAVSSYGNPRGSSGNELPYQNCLDANTWFRDDAKNMVDSIHPGTGIIPPLNAGWDPRPRKEDPSNPYGEPHGTPCDYCQNAQPSEIAANLGQAVDWIEDGSNAAYTSGFKSVLFYAWNEHAEGGWLAPTYGDNYSRLDAIKSMMASKASAYGYMMVTSTSTTTTTTTSTSSTPSTISSTTSTTSTSTTTSTTTTIPECFMPGNYPDAKGSCSEVTLTEIVRAINEWASGGFALGEVIDLIISWADPVAHPPV